MAFHVEKTRFFGVFLITPDRFGDARGYFEETYNREALRAHGINTDFIQDNQSLSVNRYTIRGLHFQTPPFAQAKLIRVLSGKIFDVAVDIRRGSPTFGQHITEELSAENARQLFIPTGFAHGFCTCSENTVVAYKISAPYAPEYDCGLYWADPKLGIDWPASDKQALLSDKDRALPMLENVENLFEFNQKDFN
ncbi:MAG: dTDP-4-dehydrorhamnose 3,5-epimerase [Rhodospirillales bacterium]|nr:dTDP-4-dehydrorhamnose 3,5-epimerase [Alphaproteobacteria bacterium]MCB9981757.1 dTDP-4-dehydrorhamnose 3,5-epimerase [Rhodospirillales bacterium]